MSTCTSAPAQNPATAVVLAPTAIPSGSGWGFSLTYTPGGNANCPDSLVCAVNSSSSTIAGYVTLTNTAVYFCDTATWSNATCNQSAITSTCTAGTAATASCMVAATGGIGLSPSVTNYWYSVTGGVTPLVLTIGSGTVIGANTIAALTLPSTVNTVASFNFSVAGVTYATVAVSIPQIVTPGNAGTCSTPGNAANSQGVKINNPNDVHLNFTLTQQTATGVNIAGCPVNAQIMFTDSTQTAPVFTISIVDQNTLYWWAGAAGSTKSAQTFSSPIPLLAPGAAAGTTTQPMYILFNAGSVTVGLGNDSVTASDRILTFKPNISNMSNIAYAVVPSYAANSTGYYITLGNATAIPPGVENNFIKYWWAYLIALIVLIIVIVVIAMLIHSAGKTDLGGVGMGYGQTSSTWNE